MNAERFGGVSPPINRFDSINDLPLIAREVDHHIRFIIVRAADAYEIDKLS